MPQVGTRHFAYTKAGKMAAMKLAKKQGKKVMMTKMKKLAKNKKK